MKMVRCIVPALVMVAVSPAFCGENTGRLAGKVLNKKGEAVPGVKMTLKRLDISWVRDLKIDAKGNWIQVGLEVKEYELLVTAPGFVDHKEQVRVPLGETKRVDITLYTPEEAREKAIKEGRTVEDQGAALENKGTEAFNLAVMMYNDQKFAEALPLIDQAYSSLIQSKEKTTDAEAKVKLEENLEKVGRVYGICLFEVGKADEAKRAENWAKAEPFVLKGLERNPKDVRGLTYMLEMSRAKNDQAAVTKYQAALDAVAGPNPGVAYNQGVEAYNAGKMKEAKPFFQKAIQIDPKFAEAYYLLAMCEFGEMNLKNTKENLVKYLEVAPTGKHAGEVKEMLKAPELKNVK